MLFFSLFFLIGDLYLQTLPSFLFLKNYPSSYLISASIALVVVLFVAKIHQSLASWLGLISLSVAGLGLGVGWTLHDIQNKMHWTIPENVEGKTILVWGKVANLPNKMEHLVSFRLKLNKIQYGEKIHNTKSLIQLTWRSKVPLDVHIGDHWRLKVRLKRIHGLANPGGFDFEAYAFEEGIRASGYVVEKERQQLLSRSNYFPLFGKFREKIQTLLQQHVVLNDTACWIPALVIGERHGISPNQWHILRKTGTNHLMAIAGLHIGFWVSFIFFVVDRLWRSFPRFLLILPAQLVAGVFSFLAAIFYSGLAGFSLPTQRACIMLSVFFTAHLCRAKVSSWYSWSTALVCVLIVNPLAILTESFWLSFSAVGIIIYGMSGRVANKQSFFKWLRLPYITTVGLMPFCFWFFQQGSLVSFFANVVSVPWMGFVILPLCLLGSFSLFLSTKLGVFLLFLADKNLSFLWKVLTWFAELPLSNVFVPIHHHWVLLTTVIGILFLLLPKGFPGKWLGLFFMIPLFNHSNSLHTGEMAFTLLDVGQGLASVIRTRNHIVIFDTGTRLNANYDMGESVVIPYLHYYQVKKVDMLIVSHGDNDHAGGAFSILNHFPVDAIRTSVPKKFKSFPSQYCLKGQSWIWDGVTFRFLYPGLSNLDRKNDSSCVLQISNGYQQILLTGDIEKYAEGMLLKNQRAYLPSTILVAPHHGSKTSSLNAFIQTVHPQYVLFPVGYRNRYHLPNKKVVERYKETHCIMLDSIKSGAIEMVLNKKISLKPYRTTHLHYWN